MKLTNVFFSLIFLLAPTCGYADSPLPESTTGAGEVYVVDFYDGKETAGNQYLEGLAADGKIEILSVLGDLGDAVIKAKEAVVLEIRKHPSVVVVDEDDDLEVLGWVDETQPDYIRDGARILVENTPYGINMVNAADLPKLPSGKSWKKVCVVDTGYNNAHPDLPTLNTNTDGFSPYGPDQKWFEDNNSGHGTHCAGTIGAIGGNDAGVNSVMNTYGSGFENFFIGKGLTNSGRGSSSGVMVAMNKCKENGADVISMSLGGGGPIRSFSDAAKSLWKQGVLLIAAAGNGGNSAKSYPASYEHIMSVAAVNSNRVRASFSQFNDQVEISGPGVGVVSTYKGSTYRSLSGTSMATPHVAGVAGLVWSHFPDCKPMQIRYALTRTAVPPNGQSRCNVNYGHGIVDAKAAYDFLKARPCNSWPAEFSNPDYVKSGCYVPADATDWPTASPVAAPDETPAPTSPGTPAPTSLDSCLTKFCPWKTSGECDEIQNCHPTPAPTSAPTFSPTAAPTNSNAITVAQYDRLKNYVAISGDKNHIWAIGTDMKTYYKTSPGVRERQVWAWRMVAVAVSGNGNLIWGINQYGYIYYRIGVNDRRWRRIDGLIATIDCSDDGQLWGTDRWGGTWYRRSTINGWQNKNTPTHNAKWIGVSGDGNHQWVVTRDHKVYYKSGAGTSGSWTTKDGPPGVNQISVNRDGNHIWAVDINSVIYYRNGVNGSWKAVYSGASQISVASDGNFFLGRKSDGTLWKFEVDLNQL